ncbi:DMT family transporter [uncultured Campylobacter sp.]|uniref:DMT family transporter n=1 Tax=uncultured Campylobacter sp. TaxID=218934 RepID=UPI002624DB6F|nr:DMT family transporter [uncultured Campylobacter sp.]
MLKNRYSFGIILTIISGISWGFAGACGQYLFEVKELDPKWLATVRIFYSALFLGVPVIFKFKKEAKALLSDKVGMIELLIFAIFGLFVCHYTYYMAIELSNAAIATVLQYTAPAMILVYVAIKNRAFPKKRELLALLFAMVGVFLLATHGKLDSFQIPKKALIIGLISAVCVAIYTLSPINNNKKYGTVVTLAMALIVGSFFSIFATGYWGLQGAYDIESFLAAAGVVFFGTIVSFTCYLYGVSIIGPSRASLITAIEPVSAAVFVYLWFGTKFVFVDYVGFVLILACTALLARK